MEEFRKVWRWLKTYEGAKWKKVTIGVIVMLILLLAMGCGTLQVKGSQEYEYYRKQKYVQDKDNVYRPGDRGNIEYQEMGIN